MSQGVQDHETVSIYPLDPDVLEQLLVTQGECVFNWCTKDSWPVGVIMSYVWAKGRVWATLSKTLSKPPVTRSASYRRR